MLTRFVLLNVSHSGNVGAVARAMKVMGFDDLVLVAPRWPDVLQRDEARQRASGALDVLDRARVVATLDEALDGITHLCATAMTPRDFGPPTVAPREYLAGLAAHDEPGVAFLFGPERYGMSNADVYRCHAALQIPTAPDYGSLNLAAAVQVIAYEWRLATPATPATPAAAAAPEEGTPALPEAADAPTVAALLTHWQSALQDIGFLDPATPKKLMPRLNQLFNRARVTQEEVHILRGIAKAMSQAAKKGKP